MKVAIAGGRMRRQRTIAGTGVHPLWRLVTATRVASAAGVSQSAVSGACTEGASTSERTRSKIEEAARGPFVAQEMRRRTGEPSYCGLAQPKRKIMHHWDCAGTRCCKRVSTPRTVGISNTPTDTPVSGDPNIDLRLRMRSIGAGVDQRRGGGGLEAAYAHDLDTMGTSEKQLNGRWAGASSARSSSDQRDKRMKAAGYCGGKRAWAGHGRSLIGPAPDSSQTPGRQSNGIDVGGRAAPIFIGDVARPDAPLVPGQLGSLFLLAARLYADVSRSMPVRDSNEYLLGDLCTRWLRRSNDGSAQWVDSIATYN